MSTSIRHFTPAELLGMRAVQDSAMQDECIILQYGSIINAHNIPEPTFSAQPSVICGFDATDQKEVEQEGEVVQTDASLRLPIGTQISPRDKVQIITRYDEPDAEPLIYDVVGQPSIGATGIVLDLLLSTEQNLGQV